MKNIVYNIKILLILVLFQTLKADDNRTIWSAKLKNLRAFIENKGHQNDINGNKILYTYYGSGREKYFFTEKGLIIEIDTTIIKKNPLAKIFKIEEEDKENARIERLFIFCEWQNTNSNVKIIPQNEVEGYYTFREHNEICKGYTTLVYKNIYTDIDIVYYIPQDDSVGVKYNIILHKNADYKELSLKYYGDYEDIYKDSKGNIIIKTKIHNITDHAPVINSNIFCEFTLSKNIVKFNIQNTEPFEQLIIDPWVAGINYGEDFGYDVDYDFDLNLYVYSRANGGSLYVSKYSNTGTLLWTHIVTTDNTYDGNFMIDRLANKLYISEGFNAGGARAYRLDLNGVADGFISQQNGNFREMWDMIFDCKMNRIIGVGGGTSSNINGGLINPNNGAVSAANFTGFGGTCQDIVNGVVDNQGNVFVVFAKSTDQTAVDDKLLLLNNTLNGYVWMITHGMYGFSECNQHLLFGSWCGPQNSNAFNAMDVNDNYLYYYDGQGLAVYNKNNGSQLFATSVGYSGTWYQPLQQGGIAVDDCNNIYLGGPNNLLHYYYNGSNVTAPAYIPINWAGSSVWDIKYDRNSNLLFISGYEGVAVMYANQSASCINNSFTTNINCLGNQTANITVNVNTNLSAPTFNYFLLNNSGNIVSQSLNSSSNSYIFNSIPNGTYIIKVQINPLCGPILLDTIVVDCPPCGGIVNTTDVLCYGQNNGSATLTINEGQPPFTINWSDGSHGTYVNNLSAGNYSVTIIDANNCSSVIPFTINQPQQLQSSVSTANVTCYGGNDGTAYLTINGGTSPYNVQWSNGYTGQIVTNLTSGNYSVTISDVNNCSQVLNFNISQPSPLVINANASPANICLGQTSTLTASGADSYIWSPSTFLSADTGNIVTFNPTSAGQHTITVTGYTYNIGNNIIINGNFEMGNDFFNSSYNYNASSTVNEGEYSITNNPNLVHPNWSQCTDHTSGNGKMMVVNGSSSPNTNVWCQNVNVQPNTNYIFSAWLTSVHPTSPAILQFSVNGQLLGTPFNISAQTCQWNQFYSTWYSGANTTATICIVNQNTALSGNDFAIDDIYFAPIVACTDTTQITVNVNPLPIASIIGNDFICQGQSATLTASGGTTYIWDIGYNQQTIQVQPQITSTYTVTVIDANNCTNTASFQVTVVPYPNPNAGNDTSVCGLSYNLNATPSIGIGTWSSPQSSVNIDNINDPHSQVTVPQTGQYIFIWTENNNGCISKDTVKIYFTRIPTSDFTASPIPCFGNSSNVVYTGSADGQPTFVWSWDGGFVMPGTGPGPHQVNWATIGNHTITLQVVVNNCPSSITSITLYNPDTLSISLSKTDILCFGQYNGNVNATVSGGTPPYTYNWSNGTTSEDLSNIPAGIYLITVTDANGCTKFSGIEVKQPPKLIGTINPSQYICIGQPAYLNLSATGGTPPYSYLWNGQQSNPTTIVFPSTTTIYTGQITDANGCTTDIMYTTVYVAPPIQTQIIANTTKVCPGDPVMLNAVIWGGVGPPYLIYNQQGDVVTPPIVINPTESGYYWILVEDACGTKDTSQIYIETYPLPPVNILADTLQGCAPLTVHFNEISPDSGQTYVWNFGDNSNLSLGKNPVHTYWQGGTYDVSITVTSKEGCKFTKTYNDFITVWPQPYASFKWEPELVNEINSQVQFINLSTGGVMYIWHFGDGDSSSIKNPIHTYKHKGDYFATLIVVSSKGCKDTAKAIIKVLEQYTFYAPTAFTPDGDKVNAFFYVVAHGIKEEGFLLQIFDRWGEVIWETDKFYADKERSERWDGKAKDNKIVPVGTYVWKARFKDNRGVEHEESGKVTVIR